MIRSFVPSRPSGSSSISFAIFVMARSVSLAALSATALSLLATPAATLAQSQAKFQAVTLNAGVHMIHAELANTYETRMQGLMFRKSLGLNEGMVFVFPEDEKHCMWMKNTLVPLSVAFIDSSGKVVSIHDMAPQTETSHCAAGSARYALEMSAGWFRAKGITRGARIGGIEKLPGPR